MNIPEERRMAILEAFPDVLFDHPNYPEQPGTVICCGRLVVQRYGVMMCDTCGAKLEL